MNVVGKPCTFYLVLITIHHRHLSNIDCLMAHTTCLVCFISTVNGRSKKRSLGRWALVAGTQQTLSNLFWRLSMSMQSINDWVTSNHRVLKKNNVDIYRVPVTSLYLTTTISMLYVRSAFAAATPAVHFGMTPEREGGREWGERERERERGFLPTRR
jgi:hypothetical protein